MDSIIQEEDERVETWYLLAFCLCKLKKFQNGEECMKNVRMLIEKQKITDQEFLSAAQELERNGATARTRRYAQCVLEHRRPKSNGKHTIFPTSHQSTETGPETGRARSYAHRHFVNTSALGRNMLRTARCGFVNVAK